MNASRVLGYTVKLFFCRASGHVDRFADLMVKDAVNGECFRLDHLIKSHLEKICVEKNTKQETIQRCESILTKVSENYNQFETSPNTKFFFTFS